MDDDNNDDDNYNDDNDNNCFQMPFRIHSTHSIAQGYSPFYIQLRRKVSFSFLMERYQRTLGIFDSSSANFVLHCVMVSLKAFQTLSKIIEDYKL